MLITSFNSDFKDRVSNKINSKRKTIVLNPEISPKTGGSLIYLNPCHSSPYKIPLPQKRRVVGRKYFTGNMSSLTPDHSLNNT